MCQWWPARLRPGVISDPTEKEPAPQAHVQVTVDGPSRTTVNAAGMKQGAACFQYVAMHPGVYTVAATIDGRHINNSPSTVTASIAKPCAPNCEVCFSTFKQSCIAVHSSKLVRK
jgi:hypothetical protein